MFIEKPLPPIIVLITMLGIGMWVESCVDQPASPPEDAWPVGLLLPFTGDDASIGSNYERAAMLAKKEINAAGGIDGKPIYFVTRDTHSEPKRAMAALEEILAHDVVALIGPEGSEIARELFPILEKNGVLFISPVVSGASSIEVTEDFPWIRLAPSSYLLGRALANYIIEDLQVEELSTVYSADDYNTDFVTSLEDRFTQLGGVVESSLLLEDGRLSYNDEVNVLRAGATRNVVLSSSTKIAARFVNDLSSIDRNGGWQWFLSPVLENPVFLENTMSGSLEGAIGVGIQVYDRTDDFIAQFDETWNDIPGDGAYYYYDALMLMALSLEMALKQSAGTLEYETFAQSVFQIADPTGVVVGWQDYKVGLDLIRAGRSVYYSGLTGTLLFDEFCQQLKAPIKTWTITSGQIENTGDAL